MDIWSFQKPLQKSQSMFMTCSCESFFGFLETKISEIYEGELFTSLKHDVLSQGLVMVVYTASLPETLIGRDVRILHLQLLDISGAELSS